MQTKRPFLKVLTLIVVGAPGWVGCTPGFLKTTYEPSSPEIEQLALETTMTSKAQQIFYEQDPKIKPKEEFRALCSKAGREHERTILLGCFTSNGYEGKIFIQSITDPRLDGTMEVVAAHEMLHAAYQDLSASERSRLAPKLKQAAQQVTDPALTSVLDIYEKGDPEVYANELHSHLGTELDTFEDPELEQYYQQYFTDRRQVIALAKRSRAELNRLEAQADQLKLDIEALEANLKAEERSIKASSDNLEAQANQIGQMRANLLSLKRQTEARLSSGDSSLVDPFRQAQDRFNGAVRQYNAQVERHRQRVAVYNRQVPDYKQKIVTYNQLAQTRRSILSSLEGEQPDLAVPQISP